MAVNHINNQDTSNNAITSLRCICMSRTGLEEELSAKIMEDRSCAGPEVLLWSSSGPLIGKKILKNQLSKMRFQATFFIIFAVSMSWRMLH